jgi:quinol monooxygenase YgiN
LTGAFLRQDRARLLENKARETPMLIVSGTAKLKSVEEWDRLLEIGKRMVAETRQEPGCLDYAFSLDISDECVLRIYEAWVDDVALEAHFHTPHMQEFTAALEGAKVAFASLKSYKVSDVRDMM